MTVTGYITPGMRMLLVIETPDRKRRQAVDLAVEPPSPWRNTIVITGFPAGSTISSKLVDAAGNVIDSHSGDTIPPD